MKVNITNYEKIKKSIRILKNDKVDIYGLINCTV